MLHSDLGLPALRRRRAGLAQETLVQVSERGSQDWWEGRRESAEAEDDGGGVWGWVLWGDVIFGWGVGRWMDV